MGTHCRLAPTGGSLKRVSQAPVLVLALCIFAVTEISYCRGAHWVPAALRNRAFGHKPSWQRTLRAPDGRPYIETVRTILLGTHFSAGIQEITCGWGRHSGQTAGSGWRTDWWWCRLPDAWVRAWGPALQRCQPGPRCCGRSRRPRSRCQSSAHRQQGPREPQAPQQERRSWRPWGQQQGRQRRLP